MAGSRSGSGKPSGKPDHARINAEIIAGLDIIAEYRELGVAFASDNPRASGKIECYAFGRDDRKPSAWVDTNSGQYGDSTSGEKACSLWEFASKHHPGRFPKWQDARTYYAEKSGVSLEVKSRGRGSGAAAVENPAEALEFLEWNASREQLARIWGAVHKPNISVEAIKVAGGRLARYPCYTSPKNGERVIGGHTVVALPCYSKQIDAVDPTAWVIWDVSGKMLEVYRGKDRLLDYVKMKSVGLTSDALMGLHGLRKLKAAQANPAAVVGDGDTPTAGSIELVWKTAGPTDMLALLTAILADAPSLAESHLVITNANGEAGDPPKWAGELLAGCTVYVVNDCDEAGRMGDTKWAVALAPHVKELRVVYLPYKDEAKSGKDVREFLAVQENPAAGVTA